MNINDILSSLLKVSKLATKILPGMAVADDAIELGRKLVDLIDDLTDDVPDTRTQEEMQEARAELMAAVKAKAEETSKRLRGE